MQGEKRLFTNYIKRKLKKEGARMCARRLPINPLVRQHPMASPGGKLSSEARLKRNAGGNFG